MKPLEILQDLFFVERGYLNGNHFAYCSAAPILIDTGYIADFDETQRLLKAIGIELAAVSLIVNTHTHCDHVGGNHIIQKQSGCDIALHRIGRHFIDTRNDWATWWRYFDQQAEYFACSADLDDGDCLTIGPHIFRVLYTPGHAADGIVLYHQNERLLISSDTLWERDMGVMNIRVEGSTAPFRMLESLEKIAGLDVRMVFPGHGPAFADFKGALNRSRVRLKKYLGRPELMGRDLLKKLIIYTLMMDRAVAEDVFWKRLMGTHWYRETVDLYFDGAYRAVYDDLLSDFLQRGLVRKVNKLLSTTVKP